MTATLNPTGAIASEINLAQRWSDLKQAKPEQRIRDAARELGVSEAQLLAVNCGNGVTRLQGPWDKLLAEFPGLGPVMCLTRNEAIVHERHGQFREIAFFSGMGQVVGPDIDLRLFLSHWVHGFAVEEPVKEGVRRSFQFFTAAGLATHKVYLQPESDHARFTHLVTHHAHADQSSIQAVMPEAVPAASLPDSEINREGLLAAWGAMQDTHEFFTIVRKFKAGRLQVLRLAEGVFTERLEITAGRIVLEKAAERAEPIMIFVGNPGTIQIHTGPVKNLKTMGPWFNVLDPAFNLHLNETLVTEAWLVRKPTKDGEVTSVELFDAAGENLALFFGKRKPGQPEAGTWRSLARSITGA